MGTTPATPTSAPPTAPPTVTVKINGRDVTVPKGTSVLQACLGIGVDVSYFCYHPGLSAPAVCRQCLVEVAGQPKPVPSCYMQCADGMQVVTDSERVLTARQQMLELTLLNHPVDCPICDKAGECTLQKLYMEWDARPTRLDHDKRHKPKVVDLGPQIVLDAERCILCTRCIRVCDEVAGEHQLEMANRGDREVLSVAPGRRLDHPYSINTVDVCPVGALTSKDFRFAQRAWELESTPSICPGCATGCNVEVHGSKGRLYRLVPRHNAQVNRYWMCDEGRLEYREAHERRLAAPLIRGLPASWAAAIEALVGRVQAIAPAQLGVVFGAQATNEDNYALAKLAFDVLGVERVYVAGAAPRPERADAILRDADVNPNTRGATACARGRAGGPAELARDLEAGALRGLLCLRGDLPLPPSAAEAARRLELLAVIAAHDDDLVEAAHVVLPAAAWSEESGTITNRAGLVQRLRPALSPPGQAEPGWSAVARLARRLGAEGFAWESPRQLFFEARAAVEAFAGADWGREAPPVELRFAGSRG